MFQSIQNVEFLLGVGRGGGMYVPCLISKPVVLHVDEKAMSPLLSQFHIFVSFVAISLSYVTVSEPRCLSEFYLNK